MATTIESQGQVHRPKRVSQCTYDPRNTHFLVPQGQRPAGYFPVDNDVVRISAGDEITALTPSEASSPEYTFCFEETFPEPGDFDYNDCVMGVTMTKSPKVLNGKGNFIDFTVRLRAVGGSKTIASAMRLAGVSKSDVVDTVAIINKSWDFFKYAVDYLEDPMGKATSLSSPATTWHTMRRTYIPMWV